MKESEEREGKNMIPKNCGVRYKHKMV
jgi:hypothetical protein